jgi:hypothetical protein
MDPIQATFEVVKVNENTWDVIIVAEEYVLQAFTKTYQNLFFVEKSVFGNKPIVIAPDFPDAIGAEAWKEYWIKAFSNPDEACQTCTTVKALLWYIEDARTKSGNE